MALVSILGVFLPVFVILRVLFKKSKIEQPVPEPQPVTETSPEIEYTFKSKIVEEAAEKFFGEDAVMMTKIYWKNNSRMLVQPDDNLKTLKGPVEAKQVLHKIMSKAPNKFKASFKIALESEGPLPEEEPYRIKHFVIIESVDKIIAGMNVHKRAICSCVDEVGKKKPTFWIELEYETDRRMKPEVREYIQQDALASRELISNMDDAMEFLNHTFKYTTW